MINIGQTFANYDNEWRQSHHLDTCGTPVSAGCSVAPAC